MPCLSLKATIPTPATIIITANPPENITQIEAEVVDNNVLLRWQAPNSDLPIIYYNIYRTSKTAVI